MYDKAKLLYSESPVDLIVASSAYTPAFAKIAFNLSCEFNVPWVADFRDIHEQYPPLNLFKIKNIYNTAWNKIQIKRRNLIIKKASLCTVVSKLHNAILSKNHPNVKTIYNGYDDSVFFPRSEKKNGIFTICYGGRVYADNQFQNADMFFQALKLLHDKKTIDHECFQCAFYVDENSASLVKELSAKYGVFQYVKLHEQVSNQNFSRIASQCEILLVLNSPQASGVIGTKFYEYLGLRRPILVVESDLGEMSDILQSSKSGCAARDSDEAHSYINDKYQQWREFGFVANLDWDEKIQFYTRKNQSDIFAKELLHLVDK
jgi:glycosyltransferase involved in cell wall biosynthesis